jgi:hypothetical protein
MTKRLLISVVVTLAIGAFALPSAAWAGPQPCWSKASNLCASVNAVPKGVFLFGNLTVKVVKGGKGEATCPYFPTWGTIKNSALRGEGEIREFRSWFGCTQVGTPCPPSVGFIDVAREGPPWTTELEEPVPGELRDKIKKVKFVVRCWTSQAARNLAVAAGNTMGLLGEAKFVELHGGLGLRPRCIAKPAIFPQPTELEFDAGSGELEIEGSGGAYTARLEGDLRLFGWPPEAPIQCKPS